LIDSFASAAS